jgi:serine/threonine-protein kinase HipA
MNAEIEIFHHQQWHLAATFTLLGDKAWEQGYRAPGLLAYDTRYAVTWLNDSGITALSSCYPVDFAMLKTPTWPAFLLDLLPSGAGRRALLNYLNETELGAKSDWKLLLQGAGNPPGNLRIKQAAELLEQTSHVGFEKSEIIERAENFIEYARGHGAPVSGSTGAQGDAPKFLLTLDYEDRWHADGVLPDQKAKKHYIVKFPRGHLSSDRAVLRNEAAYYHVAKAMGLRVHSLPEFINNTLFIPRFDRQVLNKHVIRYGQESLCSLAGIADFGQAIPMEKLCEAFISHVTDPQTELKEFLLRDILNVALGNTDNHARNTAITKYPDGTIALSPLYDFAPMILDEQGIARVCRWSKGEKNGFPEWGKIAEILGNTFYQYQINSLDLRKFFFNLASKIAALPKLMHQAKVDADLIEKLSNRISEVVAALKEAKSW